MKTKFTLILFLLSLAAIGQNDKNFRSHWRTGDANIRGLTDDNFDMFKKGNFLYYISNDNDYLYVDLKIEDSGVQYKILQEGLTIWLNPDGKQRKEIGIRFPVGARFARGPGVRNAGGGSSESPLSLANTIQLIGLQNTERKMIPANSENDFNGSLQYDNDGNLFYNLRIPISKVIQPNSAGSTGFEPVTIGIEYGVMPAMGNKPAASAPPAMNDMPSGGRGGGGGRGGSPGGGRGGAPSGSMGGGSGSMPAPAAETSKLLWIKNVAFATKP